MFERDLDAFMTYRSLRDTIFKVKKTANVSTIQQLRGQKALKSKKDIQLKEVDFRDINGLIIGLQNDQRFFHMISNCKKPKGQFTYIFVENNKFITFVLKGANTYPFIAMKIPINGTTAFAVNTPNCYLFPLTELLQQNITMKSSQYNILFKNTENGITFEYNVTVDGNIKSIKIDKIDSRDMSTIYNLFVFDTVGTGSSLFSTSNYDSSDQELLNTKIDYISDLREMEIIVLEKISKDYPNPLTGKKIPLDTKNYILLNNEKMVFVKELVTKKDENEIHRLPDEHEQIWNESNDEFRKFNIRPCDGIFKMNYNKTTPISDSIYYVFARFKRYYMFVKVISSKEANTNEIIFERVFFDCSHTLECYLCVEEEIPE